jgi:solute carrier family 25 phosphate transporter 3
MVSKLNANRQPGEAFGGAMGRIYKDIGFPGLWNGLVIRIFMIGTLTSLRKSSGFYRRCFADSRIRMGYL